MSTMANFYSIIIGNVAGSTPHTISIHQFPELESNKEVKEMIQTDVAVLKNKFNSQQVFSYGNNKTIDPNKYEKIDYQLYRIELDSNNKRQNILVAAPNIKSKITLSEIIFQEMPLQQFKTIGDWTKSSSFSHKEDRGILTSPKGVEKIRKQWQQTPFNFDVYMVNDKRVNKPEFREVGKVSLEFIRDKLKLTEEEVPDPDLDAITIIYTNNAGSERYMSSGWILAHRLGHVLRKRSSDWDRFRNKLISIAKNLLLNIYGVSVPNRFFDDDLKQDKIFKYFFQQLGTMKSARDEKLRSRYEFEYELLAQYIITGKITFNQLPQRITIGMGGWGRKQQSSSKNEEERLHTNEESLQYYSEELENMLAEILAMSVGNIYVM